MRRGGYVLRRVLQAVPTVLGVTVLVFFMIHLVPGDPARAQLGPRATPELIAGLHHRWGLDQPLWDQYLLFMKRLVGGDLGDSFFYHAPATTLIAERIGATLFLVVLGTLLTVVLTIPLAIAAAVNRGKLADQIVRAVPLVGLGMPTFWIGIVLILVFALNLRWFPVGGYGEGFGGHLSSMFLPALTVAIAISPLTIRSLRASMLEVLEADYITTARAKGLGSRRIIVKHVLRNALLPTLTILSVNVGYLVGGAVIIEQVFAIPGIGSLMLDGISNRDFALVQGITLVFASLVVAVNLLTDISYSLIDPRVRFD